MILAAPGPVHLIGIGGSGMSALAAVLLDFGFRVSGSDLSGGAGTAALLARGAAIAVGPHDAVHVPSSTRCIVRSRAVPDSNPEWRHARERGIAAIDYAEALGALMADRHGVAIAGTHGKTTTTAMVAHALREAGGDPSYVVGGDVPQLGAPGHGGKGPHFVAEACEYDRSFHRLRYRTAAITNVEAEHLDCYRDLDDVRAAFAEFARRVEDGGSLVVESRVAPAISGASGARTTTVSLDPAARADLFAAELRYESGRAAFAIEGRHRAPPLRLRVPGAQFAEDALVAAGVLFELGLDGNAVASGLASYAGARRRMEVVSDGRTTLVSDYAHHPTELRAVLAAARESWPGRRLLAVFQPHQASRLRLFLADFARALAGYDRALIADVYSVRDSAADRAAVNSRHLVAAIEAAGGTARATGGLESTLDAIADCARPGDVVLLLGAGSIDELRDQAAAALS